VSDDARRPWWGHNATEEQLQLASGKRFRECRDGCGARIILVLAPKKPGHKSSAWVPLEQVGEDPVTKQRIMEIHHDNCVNSRVPGIRDPARSHRIAKHEDEPSIAEDQEQFRLRQIVEG
jgi:hypothetical protein